MRDVNLLAGQNSASAESFSQTKKSGLFSSGGIGFTIGSSKVSTQQNTTSVVAAASSVQAQSGNLSITAGNAYTQTGSALLAGGDIDVKAKTITVNEARESETEQFEQRAQQSGLTISLSSPILSAAQTVVGLAEATSKSSDTRTQAMGAAAARAIGVR